MASSVPLGIGQSERGEEGLCADHREGEVWAGREISEGFRDARDRMQKSNQADRQVAKGGHHPRPIPGSNLAAILVEGHVSNPVALVLDSPVATVECEDPFGARLVGLEARDEADHVPLDFARRDDLANSFDDRDLSAMRKFHEPREFRAHPDPPDLEAPVDLLGRFMQRGE